MAEEALRLDGAIPAVGTPGRAVPMRWLGRAAAAALVAVVALALAVWVAYLMPLPPFRHGRSGALGPSPALSPFRHVFLIMMENQGPNILRAPQTPYIAALARRYGLADHYFGVTHPSLPNYVALLAGRTFGSHSDNATQTFPGPTLVQQLDQHHISWQAFMEGLPYPGYSGLWYPAPSRGSAEPADALYAKKHDPFLLFPSLSAADRARVVPLAQLGPELARGRVPQFVWITPNLCNDMHGQPNLPGATCPEDRPAQLWRDGNRFLAEWIPRIMASPAWQGNSVIFVVWDETDYPGGLPWPGKLRRYLEPGPEAPPVVPGLPWLGRLGGGPLPLLVIARQGPHPVVVTQWADHYSLLKTIEAAWHLGYLGHAASPRVGVLSGFFSPGG